MGFVFTFDIVNVKDGPTRYKHALYYTLALAENATLLSLWYIESGGIDVSALNINNLIVKLNDIKLKRNCKSIL